jgi:hypothetical protein
MSNDNPLIKDTARNTLDEMVKLLSYQITTLTEITANGPDDKTYFCATDIAGQCNMLLSLKAAAEACYGQCPDEETQT